MVQYIKFLINGGILGVAALMLHGGIYWILGGAGDAQYSLASVLAYAPLIAVNFFIQRTVIFLDGGRFWRFVIANMVIMILVSAISPLCRDSIGALFGPSIGDQSGFLLAALIGATPSFVLARCWVFRPQTEGAPS